MLVDDADQRDQDGRREDQEAPEDEGVDQPGPEPLQQLALAEHDGRLGAYRAGHVAGALDRRSGPGQAVQKAGAARKQRASDRERQGQRQRRDRRGYVPLAFLTSAEIAGTTSCRSPITA